MNALQNQYPLLQGLRVLETHKTHGLHYHCLLNQRLNVHVVRRIAKKFCIGWVHVVRCNANTSYYLAKYLTKDNPLWWGMRRWGTIGGFSQVKVNNIEVQSHFHRNKERLLGEEKVDIRIVGECYRSSILYGPYRDWPIDKRRTFRRILRRFGHIKAKRNYCARRTRLAPAQKAKIHESHLDGSSCSSRVYILRKFKKFNPQDKFVKGPF